MQQFSGVTNLSYYTRSGLGKQTTNKGFSARRILHKGNFVERVLACLWVANKSIPASYRRKDVKERNLLALIQEYEQRQADKPDPSEISLKFDCEGNIVSFTPERLERVLHYSNCAQQNAEIEYLEDERRLNAHLIAFAKLATS